jgi:uncharacterized protein (DUF1501 family)
MKFNRREFIKTGALAAAALGIGNSLFGATGQPKVASQYPVLIVVNLEGGNDGVNAVIPLAPNEYNRYRDLRPTLGFSQAALSATQLNGSYALSPGLSPFKSLWNSNKLAVVTGVSVPYNAVGQYDHSAGQYEFQSCDVFRDLTSVATGWLGRYLDPYSGPNQPPNTVTPGIDLGGGRLMLTGNVHIPVTISTISDFQLQVSGVTSTARRNAYENIMNNYVPDVLDGIVDKQNRDFRRQALSQSALINSATSGYSDSPPPGANFPDTWMGRQMWEATKIVLANIGIRAMAIGTGGYDTHSGQNTIITTSDFGTANEQIEYHQYLLKDASQSIKAAYDYLAAQGASSNVLFLTISEFGRRAEENTGLGTDHGFGSMAFAAGDMVNNGIYGSYPSLNNLYEGYSQNDGSLDIGCDFRNMYSDVLNGLYGVDPQPILDPQNQFPDFQPLGFL